MASLNPLFSIYPRSPSRPIYHQNIRGRSLRQRVQELLRCGTHPLAGDTDARLSASDERRHAPAHRRRHRARRRSETDHRGRTDHQSRCDDPGAIPGSAEGLQHDTGVAIIFVTHNLGIIAQDVRPDGGDVRRSRSSSKPRCGICSMRRNILTPRRYLVRCRNSVARNRCMPSRANRPISRACRRAAPFHPRCAEAMPLCAEREPQDAQFGPGLDGTMLARHSVGERSL